MFSGLGISGVDFGDGILGVSFGGDEVVAESFVFLGHPLVLVIFIYYKLFVNHLIGPKLIVG